MNRYSEMSDFEIEHLVAEYRLGKKIPIGINRHVFIPKICSQYYDYFKLMIDNEISLIKHPDFYDAVYRFGDFKPVRSTSTNPCRAIAECFLLMGDAKRGDEKAQ